MPSAPVPPWVASLNPEQRQAVETLDGPLLVLSGAGTGKTRVLTARLGYLLASGRARPWQILAVTFTNKAAREMRERVGALVGPSAEQLWLGTFHAQAVRILRRHAERVGLKSNFTILDADDQVRLLKQVMDAEGMDAQRWTAQLLMGLIQRWKDRGLTPDGVGEEDRASPAGEAAHKLYGAYQDRLLSLNAVDFGDLLLHCLSLFKAAPEVLAEYQERFRYILVDEYQDTNVAQYLWLRLLAMGHRNICCVGDDDQSIYSWRGAEIGNILRFEKDFPGARIIRLERNYRSTPRILASASAVISRNRGRLGKELRSARDGAEMGPKLRLRSVWDGEAEARFVVDEIEAQAREGTSLAQMAILVRAGFQTREFEDRLIVTGTPYKVIGGPRFYERQEIRDAVAYLRLIEQPDDDLAFERIVNKPRRGIGDATLKLLHEAARRRDGSLMATLSVMLPTDELPARARSALGTFMETLARWRGLRDAMPAAELATIVLEESGYTEMWMRDRSPDAPGRLENLKELVAALEEFETLGAFLEHIALVMDNDANADGDRVSLMTLHGAKGLEFDVVFLPGWEEELFPHRRALDEGGEAALEEERRLAYVGLTRARRLVVLSHAANRRIFNQWVHGLPSRFLGELPEEHVERESETGFHATAPGASFLSVDDTWSRDFGRRGFAGRTLDLKADQGWVEPAAPAEPFQPGQRVFHQKFGYGRVERVEDDKLEIEFEKAGRKRVMDSFVQPA